MKVVNCKVWLKELRVLMQRAWYEAQLPRLPWLHEDEND